MMISLKSLVDKRFWKMVDIKNNDDCWYWKGYRVHNGYGRFRLSTEEGLVYAHRYALLGNKTKVEKGIVCHKCDHPACCNPNHLYLGTRMDNEQDMKDRTPTLRAMFKVKFTSEQVQKVRELSASGMSYRQIAPKFKTNHKTISSMVNNPNFLTKDLFSKKV